MSNIRKYKVSATIPAGATTASAYSVPVRGRILAIGVNYPANTCTVDIDSDGEAADQKILDLAAANTDVVLYPRTSQQDNTGTALLYLSTDTAEVGTEYVVYGRLKLSLASGTATQTVSVDIIVEEA